jgi:hypothetical protein
MRPGPATQAALLSRMLPTAVFRQGRKIIRLRIQRFHPALEEDQRRPHSPSPSPLEMNRVPRRFTLERIVGNTESWPAALRNILALWLRTLCRRPTCQRNGKLGRRCAKGVERSKFLWKGKEKRSFRRSPRPFVVVPRMSRCSTLMSRWPPRPNHSRQLAGP